MLGLIQDLGVGVAVVYTHSCANSEAEEHVTTWGGGGGAKYNDQPGIVD